MSSTLLWQLSAQELTAAYHQHATTPDAVLRAVLACVEEVNSRINAPITVDVEGARAAAAASTGRWSAGEPLSTLDGVIMTVKDNILVAHISATWGSRLYADFLPDADETPVERLQVEKASSFDLARPIAADDRWAGRRPPRARGFHALRRCAWIASSQLPCPVAAGKLSIGFQLCAARCGDRALLEFASQLQPQSAGWQRWPEV